jgi:hypothetical protein
MAAADSVLDRAEMDRARAILAPPTRVQSVWAPLGAAALLAVSALAFATAMIMAPALVREHVPTERSAK